MVVLLKARLIVALILVCICIVFAYREEVSKVDGHDMDKYFHKQNSFFTAHEEPAYREPGLWRPKFALDRELTDQNGKITRRDRIYFRLNSDRTVKTYFSSRRPFFEWWNKKTASTPSTTENANSKKWNMAETDGSWDFIADDNFRARVTIDIFEEFTDERIRHSIKGFFGDIDKYAAMFLEPGPITRFKGLKSRNDIPFGGFDAGRCWCRVNLHRPLLSKEFQAFQ